MKDQVTESSLRKKKSSKETHSSDPEEAGEVTDLATNQVNVCICKMLRTLWSPRKEVQQITFK